ncbi:hypothetical protein [Psychrobacillus sp. NPDC096389]|uniref:hypothetical protein n=1 Tax=Psychrobacillus sp. NPDC096389 TaxID=3364490 RepID=UPI0038015D09
MQGDIQQLAAMVGIVAKSAEGMEGVISIDIYNKKHVVIHLTLKEFLSVFKEYERKHLTDTDDEIFVVINGVKLMALVEKENEQN